jgi:hypothetical protein
MYDLSLSCHVLSRHRRKRLDCVRSGGLLLITRSEHVNTINMHVCKTMYFVWLSGFCVAYLVFQKMLP